MSWVNKNNPIARLGTIFYKANMMRSRFYSVILAVLLIASRASFAAEPVSSSPYETLTISLEEKHLINKLLTTMAENNIFKLLLEKKRLEMIGENIQRVHPIRFLGTVFTDHHMVDCMHKIRESGFKWDGFVEGFGERMRQEAKRDNLAPYVPGFAEAVQRNPDKIMVYIKAVDFEGLVKFLLS